MDRFLISTALNKIMKGQLYEKKHSQFRFYQYPKMSISTLK